MINIILLILTVIALLLIGVQLTELVLYSRSVKKASKLLVACAGSERVNTLRELTIANIAWEEFKDEEGNTLNKDDYHVFVTSGRSMLLGGIQDRDIIFAEKNTQVESEDFPKIIVIKREQQALDRASRLNDNATLKIRRTWNRCTLDRSNDEILDVLNRIIESKKFCRLRCKYEEKFPDNNYLLEDFTERLDRYRREHPSCNLCNDSDNVAVISTTLDTMKNKVHFSIHSNRQVVGVVKYAFGMNKNVI